MPMSLFWNSFEDRDFMGYDPKKEAPSPGLLPGPVMLAAAPWCPGGVTDYDAEFN